MQASSVHAIFFSFSFSLFVYILFPYHFRFCHVFSHYFSPFFSPKTILFPSIHCPITCVLLCLGNHCTLAHPPLSFHFIKFLFSYSQLKLHSILFVTSQNFFRLLHMKFLTKDSDSSPQFLSSYNTNFYVPSVNNFSLY